MEVLGICKPVWWGGVGKLPPIGTPIDTLCRGVAVQAQKEHLMLHRAAAGSPGPSESF